MLPHSSARWAPPPARPARSAATCCAAAGAHRPTSDTRPCLSRPPRPRYSVVVQTVCPSGVPQSPRCVLCVAGRVVQLALRPAQSSDRFRGFVLVDDPRPFLHDIVACCNRLTDSQYITLRRVFRHWSLLCVVLECIRIPGRYKRQVAAIVVGERENSIGLARMLSMFLLAFIRLLPLALLHVAGVGTTRILFLFGRLLNFVLSITIARRRRSEKKMTQCPARNFEEDASGPLSTDRDHPPQK